MSIEQFSFAPDELAQEMLLPQYEHLLDVARVGYELEKHLDNINTPIPINGIPKSDVYLFSLGNDLQEGLEPQIREALSYGLFDPEFQIESIRQRDTEGKVVANLAAALIIARMTTRIKDRREDTFDTGEGSFQKVFQQINKLPLPENPSPYITEEYLANVQELFIVILRHFLDVNLDETLSEISKLDDGIPYKILFNNLTKVSIALRFKDANEFLKRGNVTPTNHFYALFQLMTVRGPIDVPLIKNQNHPITKEQATILFSNSPVESGFAKNSKPILNALANEGNPGEHKVRDGVISRGLWVSRMQRAFAPFIYDPSKYHIIPHDDPEKIGICVLNDPSEVISQARKVAFENLQQDPPVEPREITTCPARQLRYKYHRKQHNDKHSDAIRFTQELATDFLKYLNKRYHHDQQ